MLLLRYASLPYPPQKTRNSVKTITTMAVKYERQLYA